MKANTKHKAIGKSKPSQASLVSRGLAANPALVRLKGDEHDRPPSIRSGYSLYSSDSESTTVEVNRGLNRCAKLLANILDTSEDPPHSAKTGHAVYKHQGQRSKTSTQSRKHHSGKHQEPKGSKNLKKNTPTERKLTKASHTKIHHTKKTDDIIPPAATSLAQTKHKGSEKVQLMGQKSALVHIIPTGRGDISNEPTAKPVSVSKSNPTTISKQRTAPGFQDHVTSSTSVDRESPERAQHVAVMLNEPTELSKLQKRQPSTVIQESGGDSENNNHGSLLEAPVFECTGDNGINIKQKPEKEQDWMKWYEDSVSKQTLYDGQVGIDPDSSLSRRDQEQPSVSEERVFNPPIQDVIPPHTCLQVHQPLQESQDLLRDLVRQLTILNQTNEKSVARGYTQDVLQGLIERNRHKQATIPPSPKVAIGNIQGSFIPPIESQRFANKDQQTKSGLSLNQMLSDFRQFSPQKAPTQKPEGQLESHTFLTPTSRAELDQKYLNTVDLQPTKDNPSGPTTNVFVPKSTVVTPNKASSEDGKNLSHLSTPSVSQSHSKHPIREPGKYVEADDYSSPALITSPPRSLEPLVLDPTTIKQRSMQQVQTLQYLLRELQAVLANHGNTEVSRLLNELEEVCNTLPYTTQKQLLDLNTDILLAIQPLQSENSQLRRRLRIANHQLKSRELAEKKKEDITVSMEVLTLQAFNSNLQKQLREERQEKEQLMKSNLEMSKRLEEKEQHHQNMLRILEEKDSNLLKSRQDCLGELQDLRDARSELQSKVDYLHLQVEGANKRMRILQLSLEQRDNEIARLKSFNQSLQEQIRSITGQQESRVTSPPTIGGMSLQRMNRLLMERNPHATNKENIQTPLHLISSRTSRSRGLHVPKNPSGMEEYPTKSPGYEEMLQKATKKSPKPKVVFLEVDSWNSRDQAVYDWARSDTFWKDQQIQEKDLISFEMEEDHAASKNTNLVKSSQECSSSLQEKQTDDAEPQLRDQLLLNNNSSPEQARPVKVSFSPVPSHSIKDNSLLQNGSMFYKKSQFSNGIPDFQSFPESSEIDFGPRSPLIGIAAKPRPYSSHEEILGKPETGSVISDSTVSSITSQYEAQFQSGLRNLDAEIGKLQASLKYSVHKS